MLVSLLWAGYPAGNAVGGFMTSYVVTHFPWQMVFYVGGVPTPGGGGDARCLDAGILAVPRFAREDRRPRGALGHCAQSRSCEGTIQIGGTRQAFAKTKVRLRDLFTEGRAAGTILLWLILYLGFATTTVIILQTPTLLRASGMALGTTGILVGIYSVFAVCGMAIAGRLVEKFGPGAALAPAFALGAALLVGLGTFGSSPIIAALIMGLLGFTVPLGAAGAIALTAMFYPTVMRSSGWVGDGAWPLRPGLQSLGDRASAHTGLATRQILAVMAIGPLAALCVLLRSAFVRTMCDRIARASEATVMRHESRSTPSMRRQHALLSPLPAPPPWRAGYGTQRSGALAIGSLVIGRMAVNRLRLRHVVIDDGLCADCECV